MNHTDIARVLLWMGGALVSFTMMAVSVRELSGIFNVFETFALRSACGMVFLLGLAFARPSLLPLIRTRRFPLHFLRNAIHFVAQASWAVGVVLLPLATVFALEFTTPIWLAILAVIFLRERLTFSRAGSVVLGFLGVLVVMRPGLEVFRPVSLLVLASALGYAASSVAIKKLTATESTFTILFFMNLIQLPLNLVGSDPLFLLKLDAAHLWPAAGIAVAGLASHYCLVNAFRWGDAVIVTPLDFLRIPLIALIGWWFYSESLEIAVFAGAALIVAGIVWNLTAEARQGPQPSGVDPRHG